MKVNLDDLTIGQVKCMQSLNTIKKDSPYKIGETYFIRTVTMSLVGKLVHVFDNELLLAEASWIADTGRFHQALKDGAFDEIEPFVNDVIVNRQAIIDATIWDHILPTTQK